MRGDRLGVLRGVAGVVAAAATLVSLCMVPGTAVAVEESTAGGSSPVMAAAAQTKKTTSYVDAQGKPQTADATVVTGSSTTWTDSWYVVEGDVTIDSRVTVTGSVSLILADGASLTASKGISVEDSNALSIYGQTQGSGRLTATGEWGQAGIGGGGEYRNAGTISIAGGVITANGGSRAAGIGGGSDGSGGTITISGGVVTATAATNYGDPAAIGGGAYGDAGTITITGGTVTATGAGKGIGSGAQHRGGSIAISGGQVTANGIGTGSNGASVTTTITGGIVYCTDTSNGGINTANKPKWTGLVAEDGKNLTLYGGTFTVPAGMTFTVPSDTTLTVPSGMTLTLGHNTTITNEGTIVVEPGGAIDDSAGGKFAGNGKFLWQVTPAKDNIVTPAGWTYDDSDHASDILDKAKVPQGAGTATYQRGGQQFDASFAEGWTEPSLEYLENGTTWNETAEAKNIGLYRLKFAKDGADPVYSSTFVVSKADSSLDVVVKHDDKVTTHFTYGDTITVEVTPKAKSTTRAAADPGANQASLYESDGATLLAGPVTANDEGVYVLTYDTSGKQLKIGTSNLLVKFGGDDNGKNPETTFPTVNLSRKRLSGASVAESARKGYDGTTEFKGLDNVALSPKDGEVLEGDNVQLSAGGAAASENVGTHKFTASSVSLSGEQAGWYEAPAACTVSGDVTIVQAKPNDPSYPEVASRTATSVTLKAIVPTYLVETQKGLKTQYRVQALSSKGWSQWQESVVFDNLAAGVEYAFEAQFVPDRNENWWDSSASRSYVATNYAAPAVEAVNVPNGGDVDVPTLRVKDAVDGLTYQYAKADADLSQDSSWVAMKSGVASNADPDTSVEPGTEYVVRVKGSDDDIDKPGTSAPSDPVTMPRTATLKVDPSSLSFEYVYSGAASAGQQVTVKNTGNSTATSVQVALDDETAFLLSGSLAGSIASGKESSFTVSPKAGLSAGRYEAKATVTYTATGGKSATVEVPLQLDVVKSKVDVTLTANQQTSVTYGDTVSFEATVTLTGASGKSRAAKADPVSGQVALYVDNTPVSKEHQAAENGKSVTLELDTTNPEVKRLLGGPGERSVTARFIADNDRDGGESASVKVTVSAKALTCAKVEAASKPYDGTAAFRDVPLAKLSEANGVVGSDVVSGVVSGEAVGADGKADANAGKHSFAASNIVLSGADAAWYTLAATEVSAGMVSITKATPGKPSMPTVKERTADSVTLSEIEPPSGLKTQYRVDGRDWQDSPEFKGLDAAKAHVFEARFVANDKANWEDGLPSDPLTVYPQSVVLNQMPSIAASDQTITVGDSFDPMSGVSALDAEDGDLTAKITFESEVDATKPGEYQLTYTVTDSQGATASKTVTVTVKAKEPEPGPSPDPGSSPDPGPTPDPGPDPDPGPTPDPDPDPKPNPTPEPEPEPTPEPEPEPSPEPSPTPDARPGQSGGSENTPQSGAPTPDLQKERPTDGLARTGAAIVGVAGVLVLLAVAGVALALSRHRR